MEAFNCLERELNKFLMAKCGMLLTNINNSHFVSNRVSS